MVVGRVNWRFWDVWRRVEKHGNVGECQLGLMLERSDGSEPAFLGLGSCS
jgi:hypothetical protein